MNWAENRRSVLTKKYTKDLYTRLEAAGYKPNWVRKNVMPDWWEDSLASNPVMRLQAELMLSKFLGVPPSLLAQHEAPIPPVEQRRVHYKRLKSKKTKDLGPVYLTVKRAAEIAVRCLKDDAPGFDSSRLKPDELRAAILEDNALVSFETLLKLSWDIGIPVIRVRELPPGYGKTIDGAAMEVSGRPVIIITSSQTSEGFLPWILAHELGHVLRGHLKDGPIIDVNLNGPKPDSDPLEKEANEFAALLVFGSTGFAPCTDYLISGERLADAAMHTGYEQRIAPGLIATSWARNMSRSYEGKVVWAIATNALKALGEENVKGSEIRRHMRLHLDSERVSESDAHFLAKVSGLNSSW